MPCNGFVDTELDTASIVIENTKGQSHGDYSTVCDTIDGY